MQKQKTPYKDKRKSINPLQKDGPKASHRIMRPPYSLKTGRYRMGRVGDRPPDKGQKKKYFRNFTKSLVMPTHPE